MKWVKFIFAAIVVLVAIDCMTANGGKTQITPVSSSPIAGRAIGTPNLTATAGPVNDVVLTERAYGDSIGPVEMTLKNHSDGRVTVATAFLCISLEVKNKAGESVQRFLDCPTYGADESDIKVLNKGEEYVTNVVFYYWKGDLPPGTYSVRAAYDPRIMIGTATGGSQAKELFDENGVLYGPVYSDWQEFEVKTKPDYK
jgi:hypothetical protein